MNDILWHVAKVLKLEKPDPEYKEVEQDLLALKEDATELREFI